MWLLCPSLIPQTGRYRTWLSRNASTSLTTAAAGVFTAPSAGGTAIVANAALSGLTGSTVVSQRTVASTAIQTGQNLYVNVGTAQGAAATMDVYVYGYDFSTYS